MFYERLKEMCEMRGTKLTALLKKANIPTSSTGRFKKGSIPNGETLKLLAIELNVSTDYLLGLSEQKENEVKNEKEKKEMSELKFFENPFNSIIKALRREQGYTPEEFVKILNEKNGSDFSVQLYIYYENTEEPSREIRFKDIHEAVWDYYKNNYIYADIYRQKEYPESIEYRKTEFIIRVRTALRRNEREISPEDIKMLASETDFEEISIISWLNGERDKQMNDYCKGRICNVLKISKNDEEYAGETTPEIKDKKDGKGA